MLHYSPLLGGIEFYCSTKGLEKQEMTVETGMLKEDFKIDKLSGHRVAKRESTPIGIRFTDDERSALKTVADQHGVKSSDVVRGALIYAGVIQQKGDAE